MIFKKKQTFLFYNTISGQHFKICPQEYLSGIMEKLQDMDNGYCVEITETELNLQETTKFVQLLRENFCGDLIDHDLTKMKPFSLYPVLSVMKNRERLKSNPDLSVGEKIMGYLHALTIQITGICDLKCKSCPENYLQTISCSSSGSELEHECINKILEQVSGCGLGFINLVGGDIFRYTNWKKLMFLLQQYPYRYDWYTDYRHLLVNETKLQEIKSLDSIIKVIIPDGFEQNILQKALIMLSDMDFELIFQITSEEQYSEAESFCENYQIENFTFQPVYSISNPDFFKDFIFMDEDSIVASPVSKQTIFANMTLNTIDFGKLIILSNGDIHANLNFPKLGNIKTNSIREMIYSELEQGGSWFRIRNQKPCSECIYQWLCPPLSNYEIAIGKSNLCHLKVVNHD